MPKTERLKTTIRGLHIFAADGFTSKKVPLTGIIQDSQIITAHGTMSKTVS